MAGQYDNNQDPNFQASGVNPDEFQQNNTYNIQNQPNLYGFQDQPFAYTYQDQPPVYGFQGQPNDFMFPEQTNPYIFQDQQNPYIFPNQANGFGFQDQSNVYNFQDQPAPYPCSFPDQSYVYDFQTSPNVYTIPEQPNVYPVEDQTKTHNSQDPTSPHKSQEQPSSFSLLGRSKLQVPKKISDYKAGIENEEAKTGSYRHNQVEDVKKEISQLIGKSYKNNSHYKNPGRKMTAGKSQGTDDVTASDVDSTDIESTQNKLFKQWDLMLESNTKSRGKTLSHRASKSSEEDGGSESEHLHSKMLSVEDKSSAIGSGHNHTNVEDQEKDQRCKISEYVDPDNRENRKRYLKSERDSISRRHFDTYAGDTQQNDKRLKSMDKEDVGCSIGTNLDAVNLVSNTSPNSPQGQGASVLSARAIGKKSLAESKNQQLKSWINGLRSATAETVAVIDESESFSSNDSASLLVPSITSDSVVSEVLPKDEEGMSSFQNESESYFKTEKLQYLQKKYTQKPSKESIVLNASAPVFMPGKGLMQEEVKSDAPEKRKHKIEDKLSPFKEEMISPVMEIVSRIEKSYDIVEMPSYLKSSDSSTMDDQLHQNIDTMNKIVKSNYDGINGPVEAETACVSNGDKEMTDTASRPTKVNMDTANKDRQENDTRKSHNKENDYFTKTTKEATDDIERSVKEIDTFSKAYEGEKDIINSTNIMQNEEHDHINKLAIQDNGYITSKPSTPETRGLTKTTESENIYMNNTDRHESHDNCVKEKNSPTLKRSDEVFHFNVEEKSYAAGTISSRSKTKLPLAKNSGKVITTCAAVVRRLEDNPAAWLLEKKKNMVDKKMADLGQKRGKNKQVITEQSSANSSFILNKKCSESKDEAHDALDSGYFEPTYPRRISKRVFKESHKSHNLIGSVKNVRSLKTPVSFRPNKREFETSHKSHNLFGPVKNSRSLKTPVVRRPIMKQVSNCEDNVMDFTASRRRPMKKQFDDVPVHCTGNKLDFTATKSRRPMKKQFVREDTDIISHKTPGQVSNNCSEGFQRDDQDCRIFRPIDTECKNEAVVTSRRRAPEFSGNRLFPETEHVRTNSKRMSDMTTYQREVFLHYL